MTTDEYIQAVQARLLSAFDFLPNGEYLGKRYDAAAVFHEKVEQTVLFRENVTDWYENTQVCLMSIVSTGEDIKAALHELKNTVLQSAKPSRHHRCTTVLWVGIRDGSSLRAARDATPSLRASQSETPSLRASQSVAKQSRNTSGVFVQNNAAAPAISRAGYGEAKHLVSRYRFSRSFRLGFYGWCCAAVLFADLANGQVISNWAGRRIKKYFLIPNP